MRERDEHNRIARTLLPLVVGALARTDRVLAKAERWLRPADRLDYAIRRWLIPITLDDRVRPLRHEAASIGRSGLSSDIQGAIGQQLRTQYALERSVPARLANLLREFEQRSNESEAIGIGRGNYAGAA